MGTTLHLATKRVMLGKEMVRRLFIICFNFPFVVIWKNTDLSIYIFKNILQERF